MRRVMVQPVTYDEAKLKETQPYRATWQFLREVHGSQCMAVLEGEPGVGKTFGALAFARRYGIPFVTVMERLVLEKSPARFFKPLVVDIMGREPASLADAIEMLESWAMNGSAKTLFLDEAQWLTGKVLDVFRRLHDVTGCTILLIGHEGELVKLLNRYPQARDRVAMRFVVPPLTFADIETLHGGDFSTELLQAIYDLTGGNFRRLTRVVSHLFAYAAARKKLTTELTVNDLKLVTRNLVIEW